ncbi:MAG TPA: hypothetical protein VM491_20705 [Burkholderiaceae bacterium]|nr:hypothetical protein [Burkholderiaceae bacterium]
MLSLAALPAACAAPGTREPIAAPPAPVVRIGDRWTYDAINRYNGEQVDTVAHDVVAVAPEIVVRITSDRQPAPREERYRGAWNVTIDHTYDFVLDFAEPMPLLPPPDAVDRTVVSTTTYRTPTVTGSFGWRQDLRARGWERVTVPAGSFECLRVERLIWFKHPDPFRTASQRWDTIWYAPAVNRWVQREWRGQWFEQMTVFVQPRLPFREDWVMWRLASHVPTPVAH